MRRAVMLRGRRERIPADALRSRVWQGLLPQTLLLHTSATQSGTATAPLLKRRNSVQWNGRAPSTCSRPARQRRRGHCHTRSRRPLRAPTGSRSPCQR
jgi:hypothetical protein